MRPLRAIIIDDEQKGVDALRILLEKYVGNVKVVAESTKPAEAVNLIESYLPEVVFLDINMPEMNGFELLEKLSWRDFNLVFTTAHQEHALKALKINAVDYLLKPVDHEDLRLAVDKIAHKVFGSDNDNKFNFRDLIGSANASRQKMLISTKGGIESINTSEIIYLESMSNYTHIHLTGPRTISTSKTLKEFEDSLCLNNFHFMRIHNSYIINLSKVQRYLKAEECVVLNGEEKIPLSKSKKDTFYAWMNL